MVTVLTPEGTEKILEKEIDSLALRVFVKSLELAGGPRKIIEYRNLTWLPSLMRASYIVVLKDKGYTTDYIAKFLGISESTVKNVIMADEEKVLEKLEEKLSNEKISEEEKVHIAGGLAKLAYKKVKENEDETSLSIALGEEVCRALKIPWAVEVLESIKGLDFPVNKEELIERLKGIRVKERKIEEILESLEYPIKSPAELLHKIKEKLG